MSALKAIPQEFQAPCEHPGRLEELEIEGFSSALVYVPYGYDSGTRNYPVFYLLHGGGGDPRSFFSEDGLLKNMLDHMIESRQLKPLIVAAPTYYPLGRKDDGVAYSGEAVHDFGPVLMNRIIPLVDGKYRTVRDRMGRGVGGFSMGAVATWFILMAGTDLFHWFMPMSGDCWICGELGGGKHARQTVSLMETALWGKEFFIHALTGSEDIAFPNLDPQMQAMKEHPDVFDGKVKYSVLQGGVHDYPDIRRYIYNALPGFFTGC